MNIFEVMTKIAEKAAQTSMWEGGILNWIDGYIFVNFCHKFWDMQGSLIFADHLALIRLIISKNIYKISRESI